MTVKTKREDILRKEEVLRMLRDAEKGETIYRWTDRAGKRRSLLIRFKPVTIKCLIAMLWLFGKRISEVLKLRVNDVSVKYGYTDVWEKEPRGFLIVRFTVLKKKDKKSKPIPEKKAKRIRIKNNLEFAEPILRHITNLKKQVEELKLKGEENPNPYLFAGHSRGRILRHVDTKTGKTYVYEETEKRRMSRVYAYQILKGLNPNCWLHLFRHSLATQLAEEGYTGVELLNWFDWSRYDTALKYIRGSPKLTEKVSRRTF